MENKYASNGIAEELIRAIAEFGALEYHYKTLVEKTNSELENGLADISTNERLEAGLKLLDDYKNELIEAAELRRRTMRWLRKRFPGDPNMWCCVKHAIIAEEQVFEAWQASENDGELFDLWLEANRATNRAITRFLGLEITDCAACLSDMLKGEHNEA